MQKARITYFDTAKAVAILFIIIGHTGIVYNETMAGGMPERIVHLAFTFHLPVFFVASGYFFKTTQNLDATFLKKATRTLLSPYVMTCILIIVVSAVIVLAQGGGLAGAKAEAIRWTEAALYGAGAQSPLAFFDWERIGGIWFLLGLFWAQLIVLACSKVRYPLIALLAVFILGWLSARYVWLPWSIQSGMCAALFVYAGVLARTYDIFNRFKLFSPVGISAFCLWMVYLFATLLNMSFAEFALPSGILDIVGELCAAYSVIAICKAIGDKAGGVAKPILWVGQNTLAIFAIHIFEDNVLLTFWLDLLPVLEAAFPIGGWVVFLLARIAVIAVICLALYWIPGLSKIYFPRAPKNVKAQ